MNTKKEEIIEAEFSVVEDRTDGNQKKHIWVLAGANLIEATLAKISWQIFDHGRNDISVNCYVSQIEGIDVEDAFDWRVFENFNKIPTKEEQKKMVKDALAKHNLHGEIWPVGERYAQGHLSALGIQKRIKGGAYVSA